jgi:hypothetical protein
MIGCDKRCFSELGKTRIRTKWFGRRQKRSVCKVRILPNIGVHNRRRDKTRSSSVQDRTSKRRESSWAGLWPAIAFRLKTFDPARGTERANSRGPPRARVCYRTAKYPLPGTYRGAKSIGICQLLGVVCEASHFQAQFAMREETNNDRFFATAGRTATELGQGQKLSQRELRQFKLTPAFGLKIVHEFEKQRFGGFHQIRPPALKENSARRLIDRINVLQKASLGTPYTCCTDAELIAEDGTQIAPDPFFFPKDGEHCHQAPLERATDRPDCKNTSPDIFFLHGRLDETQSHAR